LLAQRPQTEPPEVYFRQAFGDRVRLDPARVREVLNAPADRQIAVDEDRDGGIDAIYFVDRDARHLPQYRPIVVKALAPAGNFPGNRLNLAHTILAADWNGDGSLDRVVVHLDDDGDGDIDRMLMTTPFQVGPMHLSLAEDVSDDNRLWFHRNYQYDVPSGWWRTDWNGDEAFYFFSWQPDKRTWLPAAECPFTFYDTDGDGFADEALRTETRGTRVGGFRYSFDLDGDANRFQPHDYDFSFTGIGPAEIPEAFLVKTRIGLYETQGYLHWKNAREWVKNAQWTSVALTWDEADNNIDMQSPNRFGEGENHPGFRNERWEGVLNHPTETFPQSGGPSAGPFNRRTEVDTDYNGRMELYWSSADRHIHLRGAETGIQRIDFDLDGKMDMEIRAGDRNRDGYFDTWEVDVNGDGVVDRSYGAADRMVREESLSHAPVPADLRAFHVRERRRVIDDSVLLIGVMKDVLRKHESAFREDEAEGFWRDRLHEWRPEIGAGAKMRASLDAERLYADVVRERYFDRILRLTGDETPLRRDLLRQFGQGRFRETAALLSSRFRIGPESRPVRQAFAVSNPGSTKLWRYPVELPVSWPGLTGADSQLSPAALTSQAGKEALYTLLDLPPGAQRTFHSSDERKAAPSGVLRTGRAGDLVWIETGRARFEFHHDGGIWFQGVAQSLLDNQPAESSGEGPRVLVASVSPRSAWKVADQGSIRVALEGGAASATAFAWQDFVDVRVKSSARLQPAGAERRVGDTTVWDVWTGETGVAVLRAPAGDGAFRLAGYWRAGDRKPFWPARSNWDKMVGEWLGPLLRPPVVTSVHVP
jgi:hypothetical protein